MGAFSSFWRRTVPPYYKYAVFLLCGFDLVFSCVVLAISEAYYKAAALVLPIAYRMFDDTMRKGKENFTWTESMHDSLELYKYKLMVLWVCCTICVLFSMVLIIPQFFDFNDARGNPSHLCLVRRRLGVVLFVLQLIIDIVLGAAILWAWIGCGETVGVFNKLFYSSEAEEIYVSELEQKFDCFSDDDKEVKRHEICWNIVDASFIKSWWMDAILITFIVGHVIVFLLTPLFNRQLVKPDEDDYAKEDLLEA